MNNELHDFDENHQDDFSAYVSLMVDNNLVEVPPKDFKKSIIFSKIKNSFFSLKSTGPRHLENYLKLKKNKQNNIQVLIKREKALADREKALADREKALADREKALADREKALNKSKKSLDLICSAKKITESIFN